MEFVHEVSETIMRFQLGLSFSEVAAIHRHTFLNEKINQVFHNTFENNLSWVVMHEKTFNARPLLDSMHPEFKPDGLKELFDDIMFETEADFHTILEDSVWTYTNGHGHEDMEDWWNSPIMTYMQEEMILFLDLVQRKIRPFWMQSMEAFLRYHSSMYGNSDGEYVVKTNIHRVAPTSEIYVLEITFHSYLGYTIR